jgi:hypothetical protein
MCNSVALYNQLLIVNMSYYQSLEGQEAYIGIQPFPVNYTVPN